MSCSALLDFNFLISLRTVFLSTGEIWNFQIFYCVQKKSVQGISTSSDIISSSFSKVIFSLDLFFSERNGFTVCQNFLLSVIFFSFNFAKYGSFSFLRRDAQKFLCLYFHLSDFSKKIFF